jgi:PST family polysaccharide transporter
LSNSNSSYSQILRSLTIIGGASVINLAIGLLKTKVAAVMLGPAGLGQISLYQSLLGTASTLFALGTGAAGTRRIAEAESKGEPVAVHAARVALFWAAGLLAALGLGTLVLGRSFVAEHVLSDPSRSADVGWLAIGVALTVASGAQGALLNGLRHIGDLARVNVRSAVVSAVIGIVCIVVWRDQGTVIFVLAAPVAVFAYGCLYVRKLPQATLPHPPVEELARQWGILLRLGTAFMISGLVGSLAQLVVRTIVVRRLGPEGLGQFQAAWTVGMTYIGFVLTGMGTDFYPRLTAVAHDHGAANRLMNEQAEVVLLVSAPLFMLMMGLAPWLVQLLFSDNFAEAVTLLRWQIVGDVLKVASWPLGFILLAKGNGRDFVFTEAFVNLVFVLIAWFGLPLWGLKATAFGFVGMYAVLLPTVYYLARAKTRFVWDRRVLILLLILLTYTVAILVLCGLSDATAICAALVGALLFGFHGLGRLGEMITLPTNLARISQQCRRLRLRDHSRSSD